MYKKYRHYLSSLSVFKLLTNYENMIKNFIYKNWWQWQWFATMKFNPGKATTCKNSRTLMVFIDFRFPIQFKSWLFKNRNKLIAARSTVKLLCW